MQCRQMHGAMRQPVITFKTTIDLHLNLGAAPPSLGISWPAMIFWLVALGGPYLIYKCVSQMVRSIEEKRKWATGASQHHNSVALYDFQARNQQVNIINTTNRFKQMFRN